ncbi:MAG: mechanosensitive ion channel [Myxococcales bacterium]|nr:MAG: mechanosensitive ion channel [Myxococcales bacterium]
MTFAPLFEYLGAHPTLVTILNRTLGVGLTLLAARVVVYVLGVVRDRARARVARERPERDEAAIERAHQLETFIGVAHDVSRIIVYSFVVLTLLSQFGVSVQPFVAGAGLVGAAVALGSQTIVKDFVSGAFLLLENQFAIGDQIAVSSTMSGTVERMTLRITVLRDADGAVHFVPNGAIASVTNRSHRWANAVVTLATPATADVAAVRAALQRAADASAARDPDRATLLAEVVVAGPGAIKGANLEWSLSARAQIGTLAQVRSWVIEDAIRELQQAGVTLAG